MLIRNSLAGRVGLTLTQMQVSKQKDMPFFPMLNWTGTYMIHQRTALHISDGFLRSSLFIPFLMPDIS